VNHKAAKELLLVFTLILTVWVVLLFFENAYFGALFYGVAVPFWANWVGNLPVWWLNAVDTVMAIVLVAAIVVAWRSKKKDGRESESRSRRRRTSSTRGSVASTALLAILVIAVLIVLGFTVTSFWSGVLHFFGV
jgi:hypothetical protein